MKRGWSLYDTMDIFLYLIQIYTAHAATSPSRSVTSEPASIYRGQRISHSHPDIIQGHALHLAQDAAAGQGPLLADVLLVDAHSQDAAGGPVLHEGAGLGLGHALDGEQADAAEGVEDALVVLGEEGVARGDGQPGLRGGGLRQRLLHGRDCQRVALGADAQDARAVGEGGLAAERVGEQPHQGEVVAVDALEGGRAVVADAHDVGQAVEGEEDGRAPRQQQFLPEGLEHGPGELGLLGGVGEGGERHAAVHGDGEVHVVQLDFVLRQNRLVGFVDGLEELDGVYRLGELLRVRYRRILGCAGG